MLINDDLLYKETSSYARNEVLHYYKNPKTLRKQGMHNSAQLWHSRVVRSSNLTFGGFLAGTTPVLSVRSSLLCCASIVLST